MGILEDPNDPTTIWIAAINHRTTGSVVERFKHKIGTKVAVHTETISGSLLHNPNGI
jgi:hypothetical protein